tara:strand:- start:207 stop:482 length:276 start_codon:yes stop_codon:yes gene_type:complete
MHKRRKYSFTKTYLISFAVILLLSFIMAASELKENFPERLSGHFLSNLDEVIRYWVGWQLIFIWFYLVTLPLFISGLIFLLFKAKEFLTKR